MSNFTPEQVQEILDLYFENFAHRQYIGARYVPIFGRKGEASIEWDNSAPYEPLTIVLHEGNSYTSRQFVPTGVSITNNAYWAETGNFNAQVEQYRQEVLGLEDVLPINEFSAEHTVKDAIDAMQSDVTALNNALPISQFNEMNTVKNAIDAVSSRVSDLEAKPILVVLGDSWSVFPSHYNWIEQNKFTETLDCVIKNYAVGGAGFYHPSNNLIASQLTTALADLTEDEIARVKWVILEGGVNDTADSNWNYNSERDAVKSLCASVATNFPNATIYIAPNICSLDLSVAKARKCMYFGNKIADDIQWQKNVNAHVVESLPYFFFQHPCSEVFDNSYLHLNENGATAFGRAILNDIQGNRQVCNPTLSYSVTRNSEKVYFSVDRAGNVEISGVWTTGHTATNIIDNVRNYFTEALVYIDGAKGLIDDSTTFNPIHVGTNGGAEYLAWIRRNGLYTFKVRGSQATDTEYFF